MLTNITDHNKLRKKYNALNDRSHSVWGDYSGPAFTVSRRKKNLSPDQIKQQEYLHAQETSLIRSQHESVRSLIQEIEKRETLQSTVANIKRDSDANIQNELESKGEEREKSRMKRFQKITDQASKEQQLQAKISSSLDVLTASFEKMQQRDEMFLQLMVRQYLQSQMMEGGSPKKQKITQLD